MILLWLGRMINTCYCVVEHEWAYKSCQVALAYIFGLGLCKGEGTPAGPVWLGFCSGVGFGVAEAVFYLRMHYDGNAPMLIYLVRYVSLAGFHGISTALCVLNFRRAREKSLVLAVAPSVIIHGLYDYAYYLGSDWLHLLDMGILLVWLMGTMLIVAKGEYTTLLRISKLWGEVLSFNARSSRFNFATPKASWRRATSEHGDVRWRLLNCR